MSTIALIPARGGSKRIPRKNIKSFCGKPMLAWSLEAAQESGIFDRILVSTDDAEIAALARHWGAEVPFSRPSQLADDFSTTAAVMAHGTRWMQAQDWQLTAVCCIYPTAPFIQASDLREALALLTDGAWSYVFPATAFPAPIFRAFQAGSDGGLSMFHPQHFSTRSQDLPEALHDAGQFYWGRPEAWIAEEPIFGPRSAILRLPRWRVQDIDTEEDWQRAEALFRALRDTGKPENPRLPPPCE